MQCHLVFVLPSLAVLGVGVAGLIASRRRTRDVPAGAEAGSLRRWSIAGLVVAALCWSAPVVDQALDWAGSDRGYGNFEALVEAARVTRGARGVDGRRLRGGPRDGRAAVVAARAVVVGGAHLRDLRGAVGDGHRLDGARSCSPWSSSPCSACDAVAPTSPPRPASRWSPLRGARRRDRVVPEHAEHDLLLQLHVVVGGTRGDVDVARRRVVVADPVDGRARAGWAGGCA